jgi:hypothetical protein
MSYLTTPELKSFDKAVISFWFRVPQAALDAAAAEAEADRDKDPKPILSGLVPLVVFGKEGTSRASPESHNTSTPFTEYTTRHSCAMHTDGGGISGSTFTIAWWPECTDSAYERTYYTTTISYSAKPGKPINPSFIAMNENGFLVINFESTQTGNVVLPYNITSATNAYQAGATINECYTYNFLADCEAGGDTVTADITNIWGVFELVFTMLGYRLATAVPDKYVDMGSSGGEYHEAEWDYGPMPGDVGTGAISFSPPEPLAADTWHHVVVSVDMSGGSASHGFAVGETWSTFEEVMAKHVTKTSTMHVAIDDKDYKTGGIAFPGTNKVVTGSAVQIAFASQAARHDGDVTTPEGPVPSYSLDKMSVPAAVVGIPCVGKYTDKIRKVEMAEFLMFTGETLDTSKEENRRLFITKKDKNGKQHPANPSPLTIPVHKYAVGDPPKWEPGADWPAFAPGLLDPSGIPTMVALHGRGGPMTIADIDFTKCSFNWQMGRNLGTLKGKVVKTGKIKEYLPNPKLES